HTAEEAWTAMKSSSVMRDAYCDESEKEEAKGCTTHDAQRNTQYELDSVHLADMPRVDDSIDCRSGEPKWLKLMALRDEVLRVLEDLRQEKEIASNQQACVTINCDEDDTAILPQF
ncbi:MAG: class I tRNA ligase family protein, partial [Planctomycetota bacterium]